MAWASRRKEHELNSLAPVCLSWSAAEVGNWIVELGFPFYRECFTDNFINGRRLIWFDMSTLPRIGINDFEHLKVIAKAIRDLLQLPEPDYRRSIARPHRDVMGLYLEKKARTGAEANRLTYAIFMRTANKIKDYKI